LSAVATPDKDVKTIPDHPQLLIYSLKDSTGDVLHI